MGSLGFSGPPAWFEQNVAQGWGDLAHVAGFGAWDAPTASFRAEHGFDSIRQGDELREHVVAVRLAGANVEAPDHNRVLRDGGNQVDFTLLPMGSAGRFVARGAIDYAHVYFTDSALRRFSVELFGSAGDRADLLRDDRVFVVDRPLRSMINVYLDRAVDGQAAPTVLEMDSRAALIGLHLMMHHGTASAPKPLASGGLAPWQVKRATAYLLAALSRDVSLVEIAAVVDLSPFHFCRAFKHSTGLTPSAWQREQRMAAARILLEDTRLSLIEIAMELGYASHGAFSTAFLRAHGVPPSTWRRQRLF